MSPTSDPDRWTRAAPARLRVSLPDGSVERLSETFHIGREASCEVRVDVSQVSRRHAVVALVDGQWTIRDLQSSNGLLVDGQPAHSAGIGIGRTIRLGADGPELRIEPDTPGQAGSTIPWSDSVAETWNDPPDDESEPASSRTQFLRKGYELMLRQQRRRYGLAVALLALIAVSAVTVAYYQSVLLARRTAEARETFYDIKALDVRIASSEASPAPQVRQRVASDIAVRQTKARTYEQSATRLYDRNLSETDRLILRVTRRLGECELGAPPEYIQEVKRYIEIWKSTKRFENGVNAAKKGRYIKFIVDAFAEQDLPPDFFYLALQESNFNPMNVGPLTKRGYAKGMWQFIPDTGRIYGLSIGPNVNSTAPDAVDDRLDWLKATKAAAAYIKKIYSTDAQASGLLVIASYNWGEGRVIRLLNAMPDNPKERNFWKFVEQYRGRMPDETYGYVLNIVAAAVIGENPRLFKIQVDNPLDLTQPSNSRPSQP